MKRIICCLAVTVIMIFSGCGIFAPRPRAGYLPTATFGILFPDPNHLGTHGYVGSFTEAAGIVYTCRAGHIDLDHIRGNADLTRNLIGRIRNTLSKKSAGFTFSQLGEMSRHKVVFTYPEDWDTRPESEKQQIIEEVSFATAPYLSLQITIWHEILTWFGVHFAGFEPEYNSAFSWEDMYSNVLGTQLAVQAVKDIEHSYDEAMTIALREKLAELEVQPRKTAIAASEKVRGVWYTGNLIPDMWMRNFDIGLDGSVTPTLVAGVAGCEIAPLPIPVPTLETLTEYGFALTHRVYPYVLEQGSIFKAAGTKEIYSDKHYPVILEYIKKQAKERGYLYQD